MTQLANIGSEVERAMQARSRGDQHALQLAIERMLELIDLTIADPKNRTHLKEVVRAREMLVDYLCYDNSYHSTEEQWRKYFAGFAIYSNTQCRLAREKFGVVSPK